MADPQLLAHLLSIGATKAQVMSLDDSALIALAGDLQISVNLMLTLDELALATGCGVDEVMAIYASLGLPVEDVAGFGERDVEMVRVITNDPSGIIDEIGPQLFRVTGAVLARLAEATVAAYVQDIEPSSAGADLIEMANQNAFASALAVALAEQLPGIFMHQMWTAVRRQRNDQHGVASPEIVRLAIGFVDLVGFTSLSRVATPAELIAIIEDFERRAFETASRHGGRIVKSIGDEVMIAASDATDVVAIALDLIGNTGDDPAVAPRGGVSSGDVLFRLGDYYGPVVNLASRLAAEAVPGEVLADEDTARNPGLRAQPAGRRSLKGYAEPVPVWTIESADAD